MEVSFLIGKKKEYINKNSNNESEILNSWIKLFNNYDSTKFSIVNNSKDYTTLTFYNYDLIRLKYTENSKWIKIFLTPADKLKYQNDSKFDSQINKKEFFWKANIKTTDDIKLFLDVINNRCEQILQMQK